MFKKLVYLILLSLSSISLIAEQTMAETVKVKLETELGNIEIILYQGKAPVTVKNFLRYVDAGHYNQGSFFRVVRYDNDNGSPKIEVIQGGVKEATDLYAAIKLESTEQTGILHKDGVLSMARDKPNTAQDSFFITIGEQPSLDYSGTRNKDGQGFAAFGKVIKGMDIVHKINAIKKAKVSESAYTKNQILAEPVKIIKASRL